MFLTPEERGRIWYECGDEDDAPWETLTTEERRGWIVEASDDEEPDPDWSQWRADLYQ